MKYQEARSFSKDVSKSVTFRKGLTKVDQVTMVRRLVKQVLNLETRNEINRVIFQHRLEDRRFEEADALLVKMQEDLILLNKIRVLLEKALRLNKEFADYEPEPGTVVYYH